MIDRRAGSRRKSETGKRNAQTIFECETVRKSRAEICKAIAKLPIEQRTALMIHEFGGLSNNEVAKSMDMSPIRVIQTLNAAWRNVGKELGVETELADDGLFSYKDRIALKKIFDSHAEETITDEQVERMINPILQRIREGEFNQPKGLSGKIKKWRQKGR